MPAPDYETVYDFEGAIEAAVETLLTNNGITAYRQRDADEAKTPFAAIQLASAGATGHMARLPNGDMRPDQYSGTLTIAVVTNRSKNDADHRTFRARVRNLMTRWQDLLTKIELPHHSIFGMSEAGTTPSVESGENHDLSTISFTVGFGIRPDAWPA